MKAKKSKPAGKGAAASEAGAVDPRFAALVAAFTADADRADAAKHLVAGAPSPKRGGFGSNALKAKGRLFAFMSKGQLVLKLPQARVVSLVEAGAGVHFDPGHGRVM